MTYEVLSKTLHLNQSTNMIQQTIQAHQHNSDYKHRNQHVTSGSTLCGTRALYWSNSQQSTTHTDTRQQHGLFVGKLRRDPRKTPLQVGQHKLERFRPLLFRVELDSGKPQHQETYHGNQVALHLAWLVPGWVANCKWEIYTGTNLYCYECALAFVVRKISPLTSQPPTWIQHRYPTIRRGWGRQEPATAEQYTGVLLVKHWSIARLDKWRQLQQHCLQMTS